MPQQAFRLSTIALALTIVFPAAQAQTAAGATGERATELDAVVVIGSNRADKSGGLDAPAPVHLISAAQLQETHATTLNEALSRLDPSFNFPQGQNAVKGQGVRSGSLRGVAPAYTLVLVNGKRRHTTAQLTGTDPWPAATVVDINTIPISAVERIEVLKDGAAAQFGSDAIAGVINVVLKSYDAGGEINARFGSFSDGGGVTKTVSGWKGFQLGERGSLTLSADGLDAGRVNRTAPDWRQLFPTNDPRNGVDHPDAGWKWGQSSREYGNVLANAELPVSKTTQAYGWLNYAHKSSNNYVNPERVVKTNNSPAAAVLAASGPTDPDKISQSADLWLYPDGYQPNLTYVATDLAGVGGFRFGTEDSGRWDIAVSHGRNETRRYAYNTANPSWGKDSPTSGYLGSWKSDQTSLTADFVKNVPVGWLASPLLVNGGLLARHEHWGTGDLGDAWTYTAGGLTATGIATVGQLYTAYPNLIPAGLSAAQITGIKGDKTLVATVASSGSGIQPIDTNSVSRDVKGVYLGAEGDVSKSFQVGITGRYENYSDFGGTTNGKLTGRYELSPAVSVRGTISSGFHAPSLAMLGYQSTGVTGTLVNGGGSSGQVLGYTHQFFPGDARAAVFGAQPLKPEKSDSFSIGTVLKASDTSSLTADAYYLKIKDAIQVSESLSGNGTGTAPASGTVIGNAYNALGLSGYTTTSYYLNAWDQSTRGVDIVGKTRFGKLFSGTLDLTASLSLLKTEVDRGSVKRTVAIGGNAFTAISDAKIRDIETGTPKNKFIVSGRYSIDAWVFDTTVTRYGQYRYNANGSNGIADQVFSSETYVDLDIAYKITPQARLEIGAKNLFNRYPDAYNIGNRQSGVNEYSFIAPNGSAGRFVYAGLNYAFF